MWVDVTGELEAAPEAIFDVIADVEREPEWIPNVRRVRRTSEGPVGIGTTWVSEAVVMGRMTENPTEMTDFDRPSIIGYKHTAPVPIQIRYELTPTDEGSSMRFTFDGDMPWYLKLLTPLAKRQATSQVDAIFANLERLARG